MVAKYSPPPQKQENMQPETALSNCLFIHFHRDIVCHYIEICQKMNFQIDHSIPCDTTTVMIWACTGHAVYLCDEHVKSFQYLCPQHRRPLRPYPLTELCPVLR